MTVEFQEVKYFDRFDNISLLLDNNINFYIAGGVFKSLFSNKKINDIDIFFHNKEELEKTITLLKENNKGEDYYENDFVFNLYEKKTKIQFVKKYFYKNSEEIFCDFDFTVVKFCFDGKKCYYSPRFFQDLAKRKLVIDNEYLVKPLSTFQRCLKYTKNDFSLCPLSMLKIAKSINELNTDWDNPDENQLVFYTENIPSFIGLD